MIKFIRFVTALLAIACLCAILVKAIIPIVLFIALVLADDWLVHIESKRYWRTNK